MGISPQVVCTATKGERALEKRKRRLGLGEVGKAELDGMNESAGSGLVLDETELGFKTLSTPSTLSFVEHICAKQSPQVTTLDDGGIPGLW